MLTIINNIAAFNGVNFTWKDLEPGDGIHNNDLTIENELVVTIHADIRAKCSVINKISLPINFQKEGERVLLSPRKDGNWQGVIALTFNKPVLAAGAQIGVAGLGSVRKFRAMIRAYDIDGKLYDASFLSTSANVINNSALFLGAVSNGGNRNLYRIEFDAEPVIGGTLFAKFAIGTLVYQA
jgi:hypothetical protein